MNNHKAGIVSIVVVMLILTLPFLAFPFWLNQEFQLLGLLAFQLLAVLQ
jgi:hypothetical protein